MCPLRESQECVCLEDKEGGENGRNVREEVGAFKMFHHLASSLAFWPFFKKAREEVKSLWKITWPIFMTSFLLYSRSLVSMLFLGHLGGTELAGGSLAIGFANITGFSVLKGLAVGMEPICCQAYGAKRWAVLRQTYQKTFLLLLLATIPISFLWLNMVPILLWLGQDPTITKVAKIYITFSIPELLAQAHLHPLRIFLRTQKLSTPLTLSATFALLFHLPINYFLVLHLNLGVKGVALALAWNTINLNLGLLIYSTYSDNTLKPWGNIMTIAFFRGWRPLLTLALPSAVSVCLEWWWYEVMILLCGLLRNPHASVAAMGIMIQTTGLIYVVPSSLSMGLTMRVGHELGAGQPARAQWAALCGLLMAATLGLLAFGVTTAVRYTLGELFTHEPEILALTSVALPIAGLCEIGNSPQTAGCGVLTGSARPTVGMQINFGSFYIVGLPVAVLCAFSLKVGFLGLWFGLVAAQASCVLMMVWTVFRTDWTLQAERAKELTEAAEGEENDLETSLLH